jgi:hypothetical protein
MLALLARRDRRCGSVEVARVSRPRPPPVHENHRGPRPVRRRAALRNERLTAYCPAPRPAAAPHGGYAIRWHHVGEGGGPTSAGAFPLPIDSMAWCCHDVSPGRQSRLSLRDRVRPGDAGLLRLRHAAATPPPHGRREPRGAGGHRCPACVCHRLGASSSASGVLASPPRTGPSRRRQPPSARSALTVPTCPFEVERSGSGVLDEPTPALHASAAELPRSRSPQCHSPTSSRDLPGPPGQRGRDLEVRCGRRVRRRARPGSRRPADRLSHLSAAFSGMYTAAPWSAASRSMSPSRAYP